MGTGIGIGAGAGRGTDTGEGAGLAWARARERARASTQARVAYINLRVHFITTFVTVPGGGGVEEQGTWAAQKHSEAGYGRPVDRGVWTAKTVKRPRQQPAHPQ